jgi:hypothetical protein
MNNKILFKFSFENGWGDTFLSVFDIVNCVDFLKNQYPNFQFILLINDKYNVKTLEEVLNIDFFNEFFDEFKILNKDNLFVSVNGFSTYGDIEYKRLYSGRNNDVFNDINGIFDVYVPTSNYDDVKNLNIPFIDFTFNDNDDRAKDFDVFNKNIVNNVNKFISDNFEGDFESIYYRSVPPLNSERILNFKNHLVEVLNPNKKYFICSNSNFVKKVFSETSLDIKMYRNLENHNPNQISTGFVRFGQTIDEALYVVGELIILSKCKNIYYCGDMSYTSLFNWYPMNIKKVKLTNIVI